MMERLHLIASVRGNDDAHQAFVLLGEINYWLLS